jgi:tropomyosin
VQALETERDQWEAKYEEMSEKHSKLEKDLHELEVSISNV